MARSKESNLSKKPPCPGMMLPLSFTSAIRLSFDSRRSPRVRTRFRSQGISTGSCPP